eukprot:ANDGO_04475.mRNA.1 WD repeat-containing protein 89 homolog
MYVASKSVWNSHQVSDECYVLDMDLNSDHSVLSVASSSHVIKQYAADSDLSFRSELKGHTQRIHQIRHDQSSAPHVASGSADSTARLWDLRSGRSERTCSFPRGQEVYAVDVSIQRSVMAVGVDSRVVLLDLSTGRTIHAWDDAHSNEVSQVAFHPSVPNMLFSASVDGFINQFDLLSLNTTSSGSGGVKKEKSRKKNAGFDDNDDDNDEDEQGEGEEDEDGLQATMNVQDAVSRIGFFGRQNENLWVTTTSERLSLWSLESASRIADFDQTVRETCVADYLVSCVYDSDSDALVVATGTFDGTIRLAAVSQTAVQQPFAELSGAHSALVRSCLVSSAGNVIYTGAEDSKITMWTRNTGAAAHPSASNSPLVDDERRAEREKRRYSPY